MAAITTDQTGDSVLARKMEGEAEKAKYSAHFPEGSEMRAVLAAFAGRTPPTGTAPKVDSPKPISTEKYESPKVTRSGSQGDDS